MDTPACSHLDSIRADIAGFFGAAGLFALVAAISGQSRFALVTLVLMAFALSGRVINLLAAGWNPMLPPFTCMVPITYTAEVNGPSCPGSLAAADHTTPASWRRRSVTWRVFLPKG